MSLVFAALTPHPPVLIPTIGKEAIKKVEKTKQAMMRLEEELYLSRPEVIILFSPHGTVLDEAFTLNVCPQYHSDLREFGDLATQLTFKGEVDLASRIRNATKEHGFPTTMISEEKLDHGIIVPLFFLMVHLKEVPILPISFSNLDWKKHVDFGYLLKEQIMNSNKRVAVIASGDLSHALTTDAPAGFNKAGPEFDAKIQELLASNNAVGMLQLDPGLVAAAEECSFRSLLMLKGVLRGVDYTYNSYAYEAPFGVGYLTGHFAF